jgi:septum formation protein
LCPLFLASASPRRIAFLQALGLDFSLVSPPGKAEPAPLPGEDPAAYALRAAEAKAFSVLPDLLHSDPSSVVIAADTIVVLKGRVLGKPGNPDRAYAMLRSLAGKTHDVITGCVIRKQAFALHAFTVQSRVSMWDAPPDLLHAYANSGEPLDKAGAYAVQGTGAVLVRSIEGSWSNVVGLPLAELVEALLYLNIIIPDSAATL